MGMPLLRFLHVFIEFPKSKQIPRWNFHPRYQNRMRSILLYILLHIVIALLLFESDFFYFFKHFESDYKLSVTELSAMFVHLKCTYINLRIFKNVSVRSTLRNQYITIELSSIKYIWNISGNLRFWDSLFVFRTISTLIVQFVIICIHGEFNTLGYY